MCTTSRAKCFPDIQQQHKQICTKYLGNIEPARLLTSIVTFPLVFTGGEAKNDKLRNNPKRTEFTIIPGIWRAGVADLQETAAIFRLQSMRSRLGKKSKNLRPNKIQQNRTTQLNLTEKTFGIGQLSIFKSFPQSWSIGMPPQAMIENSCKMRTIPLARTLDWCVGVWYQK